MIPRLKEILAKPDPALGYINGELRFWLGWAQEVAGRPCRRPGKLATGAQRTGIFPQRTAGKLWPHRRSRADQYGSWRQGRCVGSGGTGAWPRSDRERRDRWSGPIEILARVAARMGEPDRAIAALQKLLSIPYAGPLTRSVPLTPALLRLDPMFDPLRNDARFEKLVASVAPNNAK